MAPRFMVVEVFGWRVDPIVKHVADALSPLVGSRVLVPRFLEYNLSIIVREQNNTSR